MIAIILITWAVISGLAVWLALYSLKRKREDVTVSLFLRILLVASTPIFNIGLLCATLEDIYDLYPFNFLDIVLFKNSED